MLLLDTDVCVDIARSYPPALVWFAALPERPAVPGLVVMELMRGCGNRREMQAVRHRVRPFRVYGPTEADCNRAIETYARAYLSHNLGLVDALIGECAVGLGATLCTFNHRHYRAIAGLILLRPYSKS